MTAQPLAGTEGAWYPFWSPDSRSVGFFAGSAIKRLDLGGGAPQTLGPFTFNRGGQLVCVVRSLCGGGAWEAGGGIPFAPDATSPFMRRGATGGAATAVASPR